MGVTEKYQDLDKKCLQDSIKFVVLFFFLKQDRACL